MNDSDFLDDFELPYEEEEIFPAGEYVFRITEARIGPEKNFKDESSPYITVFLTAVTEDGAIFQEKFRVANRKNGKIKRNKGRAKAFSNFLCTVLETGGLATNAENVTELIGRYFECEITHNKASNGTTFANINVYTVNAVDGF